MKFMNIDTTEQILMLVIASIFGALSTLIVQFALERNRKRKLKTVVKDYLKSSILPICYSFKEEVEIVKTNIYVHQPDVSLDTHPQLDSSILKSFGMKDVLSVFQEKAPSIVDIVSIMDHLSGSRPRDVMDNFIDWTHAHLEEMFELEDFEDTEDHFLNCKEMNGYRRWAERDLENISATTEHLENHIRTILVD